MKYEIVEKYTHSAEKKAQEMSQKQGVAKMHLTSDIKNIRTYGHSSKPMVPFWDRCTTHFRTYFNGDWDVHWGKTGVLTFDPWPYVPGSRHLKRVRFFRGCAKLNEA